MATLALKDFGRNIVRRTANGALFLAVEVEFGRQAEIAQLYLHLVVQEQVAKFEIAMDDTVRVQVLQGVNDLHSVTLHLQLMQSLPALQQLIHRLVVAEFKKDVHILTILEEVLEVAHMGVLDTAMNLDLTHQLLLSSTLR